MSSFSEEGRGHWKRLRSPAQLASQQRTFTREEAVLHNPASNYACCLHVRLHGSGVSFLYIFNFPSQHS